MISRMIKVPICLLGFILCMPGFAWKPSHTILSVGGGAAFSSDAGETQIFPIVNPITDERYAYHANHSNHSNGVFNAFIGGEWPLPHSFDVQAGLSYYTLGSFPAEGVLTQGADAASSDSFDYRYHIRSQQVLAESKWLYERKPYHPYISVGLGAAINTANGYEVFFPTCSAFSRQYAGNTITSFTYNVGVGLDYDINYYTRVGVGYRFTDLGKVHLGDAVIDTAPVSGTLTQSHLYVNEVLAQLIFIL